MTKFVLKQRVDENGRYAGPSYRVYGRSELRHCDECDELFRPSVPDITVCAYCKGDRPLQRTIGRRPDSDPSPSFENIERQIENTARGFVDASDWLPVSDT